MIRKLSTAFIVGAILAAALWLGYNAPADAQTGIGNPVSVGPYTYMHISGAATNTVKSTAGILHYICDNTPVASATITVYDNTSAANPKIAVITVPSTVPAPFCIRYDTLYSTGLTIVTSGADDLTVAYR